MNIPAAFNANYDPVSIQLQLFGAQICGPRKQQERAFITYAPDASFEQRSPNNLEFGILHVRVIFSPALRSREPLRLKVELFPTFVANGPEDICLLPIRGVK